jgi:phage protein D
VEDGTLFFRQEREGGIPIPLRRRFDLMAFSVRLTTAGQVAEVEARAWDTTQKKAIVATARADDSSGYVSKLSAAGAEQASRGASGKSRRVLFSGIRASTQEEAQRFADGELRRLRNNLVIADGTTLGNPAIRIGSTLLIGDMGRFSGEYIVQSVRHSLDESGFRTSFQARQPL